MKAIVPSAIVSGAALLLAACENQDVVYPVQKPITDVVFATGVVEAVGAFALVAFTDGYLREVRVTENDHVRPGQILALQDNSTSTIQQSASAEEVRIARQNASPSSPVLLALEAQLETALHARAADSVQLKRMQILWESRSVSQRELEAAVLALQRSSGEVTSLQKNLESTRLNLRQTLVASQEQYHTAMANGSYLELRAPSSLRVYRVWKTAGDLLRRGESIATLGSDTLYAKLDIDEESIAKIRTGMSTMIELNSNKDTSRPATITRVLPYFDEESQSYKAEARFTATDSTLLLGTMLQAHIFTTHKDSALLIPRACLSPDGKSVTTRRDGRTHIQEIKTGIRSLQWVEILEGLGLKDAIDGASCHG